jgi:EAL domain-containing protein (putative c-di-GMP-specific phosphodiesterase class I)/BarA-like signal transduction histidine kinase
MSRLLVADDEPGLLDFFSEALTQAGHEVTACSNGRQALAALNAGHYDAVLSDIRMPDMDGIGLLREVRERDLDMPVILLTGTPTLETALEAIDRGALQYLLKPVGLSTLVEAANRAVKIGALARLKREALQAQGGRSVVGDRASLEASFSRALDGLWLASQPIVRASDRSVFAHEVLMRTSEVMFKGPGAVLDAAESLDRLHDLGRGVRNRAAALLEAGVMPAEVFVNLHPRDLGDPSLYDPKAPLARFAKRVVLEITERTSLEGTHDLAQRIRDLRDLGYRLALDDLGAGHAGLTSFAALTPEIVKLDMGLIRGVDKDPMKRKLITSMASLCRDLGILVVAEGIETEEERDTVVAAGCDLLQGYLFGVPRRAG